MNDLLPWGTVALNLWSMYMGYQEKRDYERLVQQYQHYVGLLEAIVHQERKSL